MAVESVRLACVGFGMVDGVGNGSEMCCVLGVDCEEEETELLLRPCTMLSATLWIGIGAVEVDIV